MPDGREPFTYQGGVCTEFIAVIGWTFGCYSPRNDTRSCTWWGGPAASIGGMCGYGVNAQAGYPDVGWFSRSSGAAGRAAFGCMAHTAAYDRLYGPYIRARGLARITRRSDNSKKRTPG